jgi:hypothetical protein
MNGFILHLNSSDLELPTSVQRGKERKSKYISELRAT